MVFAGHLGNLFHLARNASNAFLCRIGKHPRISSYCRSSLSHHQCRYFLFGNSYTELDDIIHIIRSKYGANRHLFAFRRDNHRTLGAFKKRVVGQSQPIFGHEKSISGIQHLVILVISHYREDSTFRLLHPFRGLCHASLC